MTSNILLTGRPGTGKTTAIRKIVENLTPKTARGFLSYEMREQGRRVGFAIETLSGKTGTLAHIDLKTGFRVSKYQVCVEDIDSIIIPELEEARESNSLIIIDEIARMELFSKFFAPEVRRCLETGRVIGTIQERRGPFLDEVRRRSDVKILELTLSNRNDIPKQVLGLLNR
ncbi:MAG: nucleoside-triphosphatase [Candidatus Thorarchaeota archaeon]|jgi:nucleoside-triphosphatase